MLQRVHIGDGCGLASTLCKYDFFELGKGATSEAGKYFFRAANVWWRGALYFVIVSCTICLETVDVYTWCMLFVHMYVVVIMWQCVLCIGCSLR